MIFQKVNFKQLLTKQFCSFFQEELVQALLKASKQETVVSPELQLAQLLLMLSIYRNQSAGEAGREDLALPSELILHMKQVLEKMEMPTEAHEAVDEAVVPIVASRSERLQRIRQEVRLEEQQSAAGERKTKPVSSFSKMVKTLVVYLHTNYHLRYNTLLDVTEFGEKVDSELVFHPISPRDINTICLDAQVDNIECWDKDVKRCLDSRYIDSYHPFTQYFEELPAWDGVDRVSELARRVSDRPLWVEGFHIWMKGMVAQWLQMNRSHDDLEHGHALVPILISVEQGWGKSTFCRKLLPQPLRSYYTDSFNVFKPNGCEMKMAKHGLINLDEYDSIPKSKQATLKTLLQKSDLKYKNGNAKSYTQAVRLASFIGTTNRRDVMLDPTGSRRYLCVELTHPIDIETEIEYSQLYAQLYSELRSGEQYWLTDEQESAIQQDNLRFKRVSVEEELFYETFRFAEPEEEGAIRLSSLQIFNIMQKQNPSLLRGLSPRNFSQVLAATKQCKHSNRGNRYWVARL